MNSTNQKHPFSLTSRWILFLIGIVLMSGGISIVTHAGLGTSPISTLPLVSSYITGLTFGQATFAINLIFVALQLLLLKKFFKLGVFLQIPLTLIFSVCIDLAMPLAGFVHLTAYWERVAFSMLGNVVLGLGVALEVFANVLVLPGEGMLLAAIVRLKKPFSTLKVVNDVGLVVLSVLLSYLCLGHLTGVREGTLLSALTVGLFVKLWMGLLHRASGAKTAAG